MTDFKDNFSKQADIYAKYRPEYPRALYSFLSSLTDAHELVWDRGTGNGQAATGLAEFYAKVIATDPSAEQIRNARKHERIDYHVEKAERTQIETHSADLITVANALHWFDFDAFYTEARRVAKKNGILAAWCYSICSVSPEVDKIVRQYHDHTLDDYWQAENRIVEKEYSTLPFPFDEIKAPVFYSEKSMNLMDFIAYLNTWSATQRFIAKNAFNPTDQVLSELSKVWQHAHEEKKISWKLTLKVGKF